MVFNFNIIPDFYYLCRKTNSIIHSNNSRVKSLYIKSNIRIYNDTIIGLVENSYIIALGGTKPNSKITKKVYAFDTNSKKISQLSKFPKRLKEGWIFYYSFKIFVISINPLEVFSWEINEKVWTQCELKFEHKRHKQLIEFSCFLRRNQIFLINPYYKSAYTTKIFEINLDSMTVKETKQRFPN